MPLALKLYKHELDQKELWKRAAQEIIDDWRHKHGDTSDQPLRKRLYIGA